MRSMVARPEMRYIVQEGIVTMLEMPSLLGLILRHGERPSARGDSGCES